MKRNRIRRALCILCGLILLYCAASSLQNQANRARLLAAVDLDQTPGLKQIDYAYWYDWLQYTDGYEIMAFSVDETQWKMPATWTACDTAVDIDDIAAQMGISLNTNAIFNLSLGGYDCTAWYFADNRADRPTSEQEFYFAYCYGGDLIFVYRGHHLFWF